MLFAQFSGCRSIRDIVIRFNAKPQLHYHLGSNGLKRSTLSDANKTRTSDLFRDIAYSLTQIGSKELNEVVSIFDSTTITVSGRGSGWTEANKTLRGQGLKVHVQYAPNSEVVEEFKISSPNISDVTMVNEFNLSKGRIYVYDKGYYDFNWWKKICDNDSHFVTRIKTNTVYKMVETRAIDPEAEPNILSDQIIVLTNRKPRARKVNLLAYKQLRLIEVINPEDKKTYKFISSLLEVKASDIANYYKGRWAIELLFKWLKQNLKVTRFLGENKTLSKSRFIPQ